MSPNHKARLLLTGASGFVGRAVLDALAGADVEVHAVGRRRPQSEVPFDWHRADLLDAHELQAAVAAVRPQTVLHLAWYVEHGAFWASPANLDWTAATMRLAQASAEAGAQRFVGVGTCYEYDWPADAACSERTTPLAGHTLYDIAKDACRRVLAGYFAGRGIAFAWARLFFLHGADEAPGRLVASIARALAKGETARCSRGLAVRDFMDVRDAGRALAMLALGHVEGAVNVASGQAVAVADLARTLGRLAGKPQLIGLGLLPDRADEPPRIVADVARLRDEVVFKPRHSLDEGLTACLEAWA